MPEDTERRTNSFQDSPANYPNCCPELWAKLENLNSRSRGSTLNLDSRHRASPAFRVTDRRELRWALFPDCSEHSDLPSKVACCFQESECRVSSSPAQFRESAWFHRLSLTPENSDSVEFAAWPNSETGWPFQPVGLRYWLAESPYSQAGLPSPASNSDPPNRNCWQAERLPQVHSARQATTRKEEP
jgi:hypothetical protein